MSVGLIPLKPFGLSTDWKHNFFKLMLNNEENVLESVEEENLYTYMPNLTRYSSTRCMIIPGPISKAVCRECLSMHSK
ncbi:unnamed protein product [Albugo candida]|uniref:Uncharacterized protein n=1 Tax=Albugo candida TaxID=65357 RepID=A0A024G3V8_9STRA|nr:unnamed protein product [Albugo candida]|eukprot:CCI41539.1 unnamed protein product [Albugo candida]